MSSQMTPQPTVVRVPSGGGTFNLEEGMTVPYIEPAKMGLSIPTERNIACGYYSILTQKTIATITSK